jgi:hypothetical protein
MVTSMAQQQLEGIGSSGIPIWWWNPRIHLSDRLIQMMMMMINIAMRMSGFIYFWDLSIGKVNTYSIWQGRLEADHGFGDLEFTEIPS